MARETLTPRPLDHDVHYGSTLLADMRKRGWPVIGSLWPRGVERGTLTWSSENNEWVWEHDGEEALW